MTPQGATAHNLGTTGLLDAIAIHLFICVRDILTFSQWNKLNFSNAFNVTFTELTQSFNIFFIILHSQLENDRFAVLKDDLNGIGICPYDPNDNTTVILVGEFWT